MPDLAQWQGAGDVGGSDWVVSQTTGGTGFPVALQAARAGVVHVCTAIIASMVGSPAPAAAFELDVLLKDGGTTLFGVGMGLQAVNGATDRLYLSGLVIPGTVGASMDVEFGGALPANVRGSVTLVGYDRE